MATTRELGPVTDIPPGEGRNVQVGGRRLAVFHARDGRLYATQADCPHRGGPLADGLVGSGTLVCPLHEWKFDLATGQTQNGSCSLDVYPISVGPDGRLVVTLP